jgi:type IV secretory pathway VirB10-like protein
MRTLTIVSTVALSASLALSACKKDKKEGATDPAAADTPTETAKTAEATAGDTPAEVTPPPADPAAPTAGGAIPPGQPAATERPASITDEHVKLAEDFIGAVSATATAAEEAKTDCKAMAKALGAQAGAMKGLISKLEAMKKANEKDTVAREWFKATYEAKVMDAFNKLLTAIEPCKTDKAVMATLKDIGPRKKEAAPTEVK